jgi:nucleoside 2-deoxyribosyltransferase
MKIYLAATYGQMDEMRGHADKLRAAGHTVTSRWINGDEDTMSRQAAALMDLEDVLNCDVLLAFTLPRGTQHTGGGRNVEFGYAYSQGKHVVTVGPVGEHVFHYLPGIVHVPTVEAAIILLREPDANPRT